LIALSRVSYLSGKTDANCRIFIQGNSLEVTKNDMDEDNALKVTVKKFITNAADF